MRIVQLVLMAIGALTLLAGLVIGAVFFGRPKPARYVPVVATVAPSSETPAVVLQPVTVTASVATFRAEQLDECIDFSVTAPAGASFDEVSAFTEKRFGKATESKATDGARSLRLQATCEEQLKGRSVLATCEIAPRHPSEHPSWSLNVRDAYFNAKTAVDSDGYMRQCLESKGSWNVSDDANAEVFRQRVAGHHKLIEQLTPP